MFATGRASILKKICLLPVQLICVYLSINIVTLRVLFIEWLNYFP